MFERIVITIGLIGLGVLAYRLVLATQHRLAESAAGRGRTSARPSLLVFTSPTCAPCKLHQLPIVDGLMAGWRDRADLQIIDVTEQPATASRFGVWSLPTTIVLDTAGHVSAINQGVASESKLREQLERAATPRANSHLAAALNRGG